MSKGWQGIGIFATIVVSVVAYETLGSWHLTSAFSGGQGQQGGAIAALDKCDGLASHPHDPARYDKGVPDDQMAPGAAIEACALAAQLNPEEARAWFQLGRAYWSASRDRLAVDAFVKAAQRQYAPAMKYIGDAYLEGRGLPSTEKQDAYTAMQWYRKGCGKPCNPAPSDDGYAVVGFPDAEKALTEVEEKMKKNVFDASIFQNPEFISALYSGKFDRVNAGGLLAYTATFVEEIGGDKILYVDSDCKPLSTIATSLFSQAGALFGIFMNNGEKDDFLNGIIGFYKYGDQGARDAVVMVNRYKCQSPIAKTIMKNVVARYQSLADSLQQNNAANTSAPKPPQLPSVSSPTVQPAKPKAAVR